MNVSAIYHHGEKAIDGGDLTCMKPLRGDLAAELHKWPKIAHTSGRPEIRVRSPVKILRKFLGEKGKFQHFFAVPRGPLSTGPEC